MKISSDLKPEISDPLIEKWQSLLDITAKTAKIPAALIMKLNEDNIEVFLESHTPGNPYKKGEKAELRYGLYCETVIGTQKDLLIPDARKDALWRKNNPDIDLNMVAYMGFPINWPDGEVFGTICLLDNKENHFSDYYRELLDHVRENIENDLNSLLINNKLRERLKELNCLYELQNIFEKKFSETETLARSLLTIIPPAMQYPDRTCVRLTLNGKEFLSKDFQETPVKISQNIRTGSMKKGQLEVFYKTGKKESSAVSFLEDEKKLLAAISHNIGQYLARIQTENELKKSEAFQKTIIESSPLPIFSLDTEGRVLSWNPASEKVFGWTFEEIKGKTLPIVQKEKKHEFHSLLNRVITEGAFSGKELVRQKKNGQLIDISLSAAPIHGPDNKVIGIMSTLEDITDSKKLEKAIIESRNNLRITLDSIGDGVITTDKNGMVNGINPVASELTGFTLPEAKGKPLADVFSIMNEKTGEAVANPVQKVLRTGKIVGLANHTKLISKNGKEHQIADSASPIINDRKEITGVVLVFRDVTKDYHIRRALIESENKFRSLVDQAAEMLFLHDLNGNIIDVNRAAEINTGYTKTELKKMKVSDIDPGSSKRKDENAHWKPLRPEEDAVTIEAAHRRKDGTVYPAEITLSKVTLSGKNYILALARNITERKQAEEKLKESEEKYRLIVENANDGIEITQQDKIIFANARFAEMLGYTIDELKNIPFKDIFTETAIRELYERREKRLAGQREQRQYETTFRKKNGSHIHANVNYEIINYKGEPATFADHP
ncbi:MAG: PAS domain S-box protein [Candidatus Marinimicrobia bacterium]|nr:PAS domain S-box protein [Candidatus Neomarinimicrobiota bacterium]